MIAAVMAWLAGSRVGRVFAAIMVAVAIVAGAYLRGRGAGGSAARGAAREADRDGADHVRQISDDAAKRSRDDRRSGAERMRRDHPGSFIDGGGDQP
jgi:hypothetical protein